MPRIRAAGARQTATDSRFAQMQCVAELRISRRTAFCAGSFRRVISHFLRDVLDMLLDFADLRMHFANQIVLGSGEPFDSPSHFVELLQHRVLSRGNAMHPPKTNPPARETYPGEGEQKH